MLLLCYTDLFLIPSICLEWLVRLVPLSPSGHSVHSSISIEKEIIYLLTTCYWNDYSFVLPTNAACSIHLGNKRSFFELTKIDIKIDLNCRLNKISVNSYMIPLKYSVAEAAEWRKLFRHLRQKRHFTHLHFLTSLFCRCLVQFALYHQIVPF